MISFIILIFDNSLFITKIITLIFLNLNRNFKNLKKLSEDFILLMFYLLCYEKIRDLFIIIQLF